MGLCVTGFGVRSPEPLRQELRPAVRADVLRDLLLAGPQGILTGRQPVCRLQAVCNGTDNSVRTRTVHDRNHSPCRGHVRPLQRRSRIQVWLPTRGHTINRDPNQVLVCESQRLVSHNCLSTIRSRVEKNCLFLQGGMQCDCSCAGPRCTMRLTWDTPRPR